MSDIPNTHSATARPRRRRRWWLAGTAAVLVAGLALGLVEAVDSVQEAAERSH